MDFTLDEAIKKLQNAGLIVEDTESDDDEYWDEYNSERSKRRGVNKRIFDRPYHFDSYEYNRKTRSMFAKLAIGRLTNLIPLLRDAGIEVGEVKSELNDAGRGAHVKLPVRVKRKYNGERPNFVHCHWSRRLNDYNYTVCDNIGAVIDEFDTPEEVVEFLAGLN